MGIPATDDGPGGKRGGEEPRGGDLSRWVATTGAALALLGAVGYGAFSLVLRFVYDGLDVAPEELGWDASRVLVTFAPAFLLSAFLTFLQLGGVLARGRPERMRRPGAWWRTALLGALVTYGLLFWLGAERRDRIREGKPIGAGIDSLVPVRATCVRVTWLDPPPAAATVPPFDGRTDYLLLGRSDGIVVLYDAGRDAPIRVGGDLILLDGCPRA